MPGWHQILIYKRSAQRAKHRREKYFERSRMMLSQTASSGKVQVRSPARGNRAQLSVRCQAAPENDSRRKVLGLGMLLAASLAGPVYAENLADPKKTGGEVVKAPTSAPTSEASGAPGPKPVAQPKDGGPLIEKLRAQSEKNKALNDKKRLATSYANLESSRTVADGTCVFPQNLFGCDNRAVAGKVKYISDDQDIECQGKPDGKCGSKAQLNSLPKAFAK